MTVERSRIPNNLHHQIFLEDTPPWGTKVSLEEGVGQLKTACDDPKIIRFLETNPIRHIDLKTLQAVYLRITQPNGDRTHSLGIAGRLEDDRNNRLVYMRHHYVNHEPPLTIPTPPPSLWIGIFNEYNWINASYEAGRVLKSRGMNKKDLGSIPPLMAINLRDSTIRIYLRGGQAYIRPKSLAGKSENIELLTKRIQDQLAISLLKPI